MNIVQIVFSPTGGTQKAADMITSAWDSPVRKVDLSDLGTDFSAISLEKDDITVITVPSFGGRVPAPAIERLEEIKGNQAMGLLVYVYGNRAYEDTLIELNDSAEKSGFRVVAGIAPLPSIPLRTSTRQEDLTPRMQKCSTALPKKSLKRSTEIRRHFPHRRYRGTVRIKRQAAA